MAKKGNPVPTTFKSRLFAAFNRREWGKLLFGQVKLPTIILVFWGLFTIIPALNGAVQFWWDAGIYLGGKMGLTGTILTSPWFGLFLIIAGVAYQVLVDENSRPTLRHRAFLFAGWAAAILLIGTIFAVSVVSYINAAIGPRHLYPKQKQTISAVLKTYTPKTSVFVKMVYVGSCFDCDGYALDFQDLFGTIPNWNASEMSSVLGVSRFSISPFGVSIRVADVKNLSESTKVLLSALRAADIHFDVFGGHPNMWPVDLELLISPRSKQ